MTLRDNVREIEVSSKFDGHEGNRKMRRRAAMLYLVALDGGSDELHSWSDDGDGMDRIGRHILEFDSNGFVSVVSFSSEQAAQRAFTSAIMRDYMANGYQ